jgi:hypothetical protein
MKEDYAVILGLIQYQDIEMADSPVLGLRTELLARPHFLGQGLRRLHFAFDVLALQVHLKSFRPPYSAALRALSSVCPSLRLGYSLQL